MSRHDRLSQYLEARRPTPSRPWDEGDLYVSLPTASTRYAPRTYKLDPSPRTVAQSPEARHRIASHHREEDDTFVPVPTASTRHNPRTYTLDPSPQIVAQSPEARHRIASRHREEDDIFVPVPTASTRHTPPTHKLDSNPTLPVPRHSAIAAESFRDTSDRHTSREFGSLGLYIVPRPRSYRDVIPEAKTPQDRHTGWATRDLPYRTSDSSRRAEYADTSAAKDQPRACGVSSGESQRDVIRQVPKNDPDADGKQSTDSRSVSAPQKEGLPQTSDNDEDNEGDNEGDDDGDDDGNEDGDEDESPPPSPKPSSKTAWTLSRADALLEVQQDFKIYSGPRNLYVPAKAMFDGCAFLDEGVDGCIGLDFLLEDLEYSDCREGQIVKLKCTTTDGKIFHKDVPFYVHFQVIDRDHLEILFGREFIQSNRDGFVNQTIGSKKKKGEELTAAEIAELLRRQKVRDELTPNAPTSQGSISSGKKSGHGRGSAR